MSEQPYFIEVDNNGCATCGVGRTYTIITPDDGAAIGQSFDDEEDASSLCDLLNLAYEQGRTAGWEEKADAAEARLR